MRLTRIFGYPWSCKYKYWLAQNPRIKGGILDKLKQAQELLRVNTVWNRIIQRIKNSLEIGSSEKDLIDDIVQIEWAKEKRNERSSNND